MRDSGFPVVVKPVGLSGSRGVIRANDAPEFVAAVARIRALLARPPVRSARAGLEDRILVEEYIDGREFAVEGVVTDGAFRCLAIFDKPDPLDGPFFEETIYVTPSSLRRDLQTRLVDHVGRGAAVLGLRHGPIHAECRVTATGEVFVLEVAGRPIGGLCSRVLTFVRDDARDGAARDEANRGASLEEVLLRHAAGESIDDWIRETAAAAVMMIPIPQQGMFKGARGELSARSTPGVTDIRITAKKGQLLERLPEAGSYLGFIFARGATPREAEASVRHAHQRLVFDIAREVKVTSADASVPR
jgi:biotin carboxylase